MQNSFVTVIVINENSIVESTLYIGERSVISSKAETKFLEYCKQHFTNFDEYTQEDLDAILEDGYEESHRSSVSIHWLENVVVVMG